MAKAVTSTLTDISSPLMVFQIASREDPGADAVVLGKQRSTLVVIGPLGTFVRNSLVRTRASNPDRLNGILVGLIDGFQRQMLVDLQALFAFVP